MLFSPFSQRLDPLFPYSTAPIKAQEQLKIQIHRMGEFSYLFQLNCAAQWQHSSFEVFPVTWEQKGAEIVFQWLLLLMYQAMMY
jgi:hypothetical protein